MDPEPIVQVTPAPEELESEISPPIVATPATDGLPIALHTSVQSKTIVQLQNHYMNRVGLDEIARRFPHNGLDKLMSRLQQQPQCKGKPIFVAMASVLNELYWQLVQNFIYTMTEFNLSDCAVMICVSDHNCMQRCKQSLFPCFAYQYENVYDAPSLSPSSRRSISALEQIANLKLYYLPKALKLGVYLFILDLDVGFIHNPMELVNYHLQHKKDVDILVQYDWGFEMDRTVEKWKTWYVEPIANIGLFLCKGNKHTLAMFKRAWESYKVNPYACLLIVLCSGNLLMTSYPMDTVM